MKVRVPLRTCDREPGDGHVDLAEARDEGRIVVVVVPVVGVISPRGGGGEAGASASLSGGGGPGDARADGVAVPPLDLFGRAYARPGRQFRFGGLGRRDGYRFGRGPAGCRTVVGRTARARAAGRDGSRVTITIPVRIPVGI